MGQFEEIFISIQVSYWEAGEASAPAEHWGISTPVLSAGKGVAVAPAEQIAC